MLTSFDAARTQAAWRDFAIGLALLVVTLPAVGWLAGLFLIPWQSGPSLPGLRPAAFIATQALFVSLAVHAHLILHRAGKFTDVTGAVASFGRLSALRLTVVGLAVLVLMFSVSRIAQAFGGAIARPVPWGPQIPDQSVPSAFNLAISFYVVATAPIIEELCFRGWMQRGLGHRFNAVISIFTPAFLFALLHASVYSHPAYLLMPFALGLSLGIVAERSGSLWPSILLHALWNIILLAIAAGNAGRSLSWGPPQNALDGVLVLAGIGLSSVIVLRALPRVSHPAGAVGPKPVLDVQGVA